MARTAKRGGICEPSSWRLHESWQCRSSYYSSETLLSCDVGARLKGFAGAWTGGWPKSHDNCLPEMPPATSFAGAHPPAYTLACYQLLLRPDKATYISFSCELVTDSFTASVMECIPAISDPKFKSQKPHDESCAHTPIGDALAMPANISVLPWCKFISAFVFTHCLAIFPTPSCTDVALDLLGSLACQLLLAISSSVVGL